LSQALRVAAPPGEPAVARLKVLVADDDRVARRVVVGTLRGRFEVCEASDGVEAVELFRANHIDVVLLDVEMPRMGGVEAAEVIRGLAGTRLVPILLVSGLEEVPTLIRGLAHGADDFLAKPFNPKVFDSKLSVFLRFRDMQERLLEQNRELSAFRQRTEEEHALAKEVFARILERGALSDPRVRVSASPLSMFNGDVVLTSQMPDGGFRWMLADVAGHGLSGAIGTVPVTTLFYRKTRDGLDLRALLAAMNEELRANLPPRLLCAAAAMELDPARRTLTVCNAGMPDILLLRRDGSLLSIGSKNVPLAITSTFEAEVDTFAVEAGERVFAVSDGVVECRSPGGEMFGSERLFDALTSVPPEDAFANLLESTSLFSDGTQSDDVSVLEVRV
jgi:two-component system, HptB-dependent secretion and biofilm response regulator